MGCLNAGGVVVVESVRAGSRGLVEVLIITTLDWLAVEAKGSAGLGVAGNDLRDGTRYVTHYIRYKDVCKAVTLVGG